MIQVVRKLNQIELNYIKHSLKQFQLTNDQIKSKLLV